MYKLTSEYVWKEIGQQVVVLHFDSGAYWTLNDTGSLIWKSIVAGKAVDEITDRVATEYDISRDAAQADVQSFLQNCLDKKMLLPA